LIGTIVLNLDTGGFEGDDEEDEEERKRTRRGGKEG
jgi:hypothetical protein